jgi:hypothetical protein
MTDDTMAAPSDHTTASALGADAETTIVPSDPAAADALAWSQGDEPADAETHPWTRVLAMASGVLAIGAVAAVVVATNGRHANDLHESALPVTVHATVAAPVLSAPVVVTTVTESPVTVTVTPTPTTAPATTAAAVPSTTALRDGDDDASMPTTTYVAPAPVPQMNYSLQATTWFLQGVRMHGWTGSDALAIQLGRRICVITATDPAHMKGYEASRQLAAETGIPLAQIKEPIQIDALMQFCPQYLD